MCGMYAQAFYGASYRNNLKGTETIPTDHVVHTVAQCAGVPIGAGSWEDALPPVPRYAVSLFLRWRRMGRRRGPLQGASTW